MAEVAVIIPLYNKGRYIRRALDSVCAQTYGDFELVVVDDGSTDDGPAIVKGYVDPRIRLIRQTNAGPGAARNQGVRESTAPYLAFLDADDEWLPEFLKVSIESLETHAQCEVSVTSRYQGPSRKDLTRAYVRRGARAGEWSLDQYRNDADPWKRMPMFCVGTVVCRRAAFARMGGFYDKDRALLGEDTYLWTLLALNCRVFMILQPLAWYHTEASDLGWHRRDAGILAPRFADPEALREKCPGPYRELLKRRLARQAYEKVADLCERGDLATASYLIQAFPGMRTGIWRRGWLGIMMRFPGCYRALRSVKTAIRTNAGRWMNALPLGARGRHG